MSGIDNIIDAVNAHMVVDRVDHYTEQQIQENVFVKITKDGTGDSGFYEAVETIWDSENQEWKDYGHDTNVLREWGRDGYPKLLEINFSEDVPKDTIVAVTEAPAPDGLWVFSVSAVGSGGTPLGTTKSNKTGSGFLRDANGDLIPHPDGGFEWRGSGLVQFQNDVFFNNAAEKLGIPEILGSIKSGIRIYSGQEEGVVSSTSGNVSGGRQRNYNWLWTGKNNGNDPSSAAEVGQFGNLLLSIIVPQSDQSAGATSSGDLQGTNVRHIKFLRFNNGHTVEIYHSRLPQKSNLSGALQTAFTFPVNSGLMYVSKTSGGTTDMPVLVDYLGHIWEMDSSYGSDDPPSEDTGDLQLSLTVTQSDYDNAAALFGATIGQSTSFLDGAGVGTNNEVFTLYKVI